MYKQFTLKIFLLGFTLIFSVACKKDKSNDGGVAPDVAPDVDTYSPVTPSVVYLWITLPSHRDHRTGDLQGGSTADDYCESEATNQNFDTPVTSHRAVLSTTSSPSRDARGFFENDPPVKRLDGTLIIDSYTNFFDSTVPLKKAVEESSGSYWTGISTTGDPSSDNCENWTTGDPSESGVSGSRNSKSGTRFSNSSEPCETRMYILCVSS